MAAGAKDIIMEQFKNNEVQILIGKLCGLKIKSLNY